MTKILFFYPDNPLIINQGNNSRANKLLNYFKSRNCIVDFVGEHKRDFLPEELEDIKNSGLVNDVYMVPKRKNSGLKYLFGTSIPNKIKGFPRQFQRISYNQKKYFENILNENSYDYIIISYVLFFPFIENKSLTKNSKVIVDTHDFFTGQFSQIKRTDLGKLFKTEINQLKKFDSIWAISAEEQFIFSQFLPEKEILTIPHGVESNFTQKSETKEIDLFYVASNNPHNLNSAKWFFEKVYPLLPKHIQITIVGRVNQVIDDYPNVRKIEFAESLDELYQSSKVTICPMLSGTGLKIKVVESLSYGIPVVCNERGVDGLLSKINNGCLVSNNPNEFADFIEKLLNDEEYYNKISREGKEFFTQSLDENIVFKKLDYFFKFEK